MAVDKSTGPYGALPGTARRQGRGGHCFAVSGFPAHIPAGSFLGNVTAVEWSVEAEQVSVLIPGGWRDEPIAGAETRRGTLRYQDVDDTFRMLLWQFFEARRTGNFSVQPPIVSIQTQLVGGSYDSVWQLNRCQFFTLDGGYSNEDDILQRELAFTFESETPISAFYYSGGDASSAPGAATAPIAAQLYQ